MAASPLDPVYDRLARLTPAQWAALEQRPVVLPLAFVITVIGGLELLGLGQRPAHLSEPVWLAQAEFLVARLLPELDAVLAEAEN